MANGEDFDTVDTGSGDGGSLLRQRVTDIRISDVGWIPEFEVDEDENVPSYVFVWPSSGGLELGELRLYRGEDIEQWFDDTGLVWSPQARRELYSQLPKSERESPTIKVGGDLPAIRDRAVEALTAANNPPVFFRRGGLVTEIALNEKRAPSARLVTTVRMRDRLGEVAKWEAKNGRGGEYLTKPPADIASNLLETPGLVLPALDSIVEFPVMGLDGRISVRRGYDAATATYFAPSIPLRSLHVDGPNGPPSQADARAALPPLLEMLIDFDFESHADKTNVLALMLTPVLRPIIDGPVPLAGVRAVKAGTGKSLLVKAAFTVLTGRGLAPTGLGRDEDEAEKRLTAALLAGGPFVFLDHIKTGTVLDSASLARALTAQVWEGRVITTSKYLSLPIRCTWVATGNNLTLSDEIARRSYMIELASRIERPDLRPPGSFRHPDLLRWVRENRAQLLTSVLILARAWSADGMKVTGGPVLSSFESWSAAVGSVLRFAGLTDFLGNEERKRDRLIKVLIVDDERTFGEALELALGREKDLRVVDVTTSGPEAVASAAEHRPDVVIMGVTMPGKSGIEATRRIKEAEPEAHILVLSGHDDEYLLARAMQAGASGVLRKTETFVELARSVRLANLGEAINEPAEVEGALRRLRHPRTQDAGPGERLARLTPRELEILQLMAESRSPEDISAALGVTPATLRTHTQNLITRLGVHSKMEALVLAIRHGTVTTIDLTGTDTDMDTDMDTDADTGDTTDAATTKERSP